MWVKDVLAGRVVVDASGRAGAAGTTAKTAVNVATARTNHRTGFPLARSRGAGSSDVAADVTPRLDGAAMITAGSTSLVEEAAPGA